MRATFFDVDSPVLNVYDDDWQRIPAPGEVIDFGLPPENGMHGAYTVLSAESMLLTLGKPGATHVRVNVIRKERLA